MARNKMSGDSPILIKKYANRRLYNTATSSYVTLDHLCEMVKQEKDFVVYDAKTGEDITRSVLTQIIFEEEGKGQNLLPIKFLRQLIKFYGDSLQSFVPGYLEMSMETFSREQEKLRGRLAAAFGGRERLDQFEGQIRQNLASFENALRMFTPFNRPSGQTAKSEAPKSETAKPEARPEKSAQSELDTLKDQLAAMQRQLDALSGKKRD